jgi:hypothetical protein
MKSTGLHSRELAESLQNSLRQLINGVPFSKNMVITDCLSSLAIHDIGHINPAIQEPIKSEEGLLSQKLQMQS